MKTFGQLWHSYNIKNMKLNRLVSYLFILVVFICISLGIAYLAKQNKNTSSVKNIILYPDITKINKEKPVDVLFYFHGAGCTERLVLNPYTSGGLNLLDKKTKYRDDLIIVSLGFTESYHCSSPETVTATIKTIKHIISQYNTRKIYLFGNSMGGSLALNVLSLIDKNIQTKISAVAAVMPVINYEYMLQFSKHENICKPIKDNFYKFHDPIKQMKKSSPINYIDKLPSDTRIILVEGINDTYVGSAQIEKYYKFARRKNNHVELYKWNIDHSFVDVAEEFKGLIYSVID